MKKCLLVMFTVAAMIASAVVPQRVRKVVLVVQNHADQGTSIPMMALTDALSAKLSGASFQVINPYNSVGVNQNRNALGETTPAVSTMELARQLNADGVITASVIEFLDTTVGEPTAPKKHQYSMRVALNLADAWTGTTVCGETMSKDSPKYFNSQIVSKRQKYLGDLLYAATDACAEKLLNNPRVSGWVPTPPPPPLPPRMPLFDRVVDKLFVEMLSSPQFIKNYEEQKNKGEHFPIAVVGGMENESGRKELDAGLKSAGERFRKKMFDSKLFEVKDDAILVNLAKRIVASGNSATENGDLMEALKQHGSPDFFIVGNLNHFADLDGMGYYKFRMTIHSLRSGKIVWEGIETITTNTEATK